MKARFRPDLSSCALLHPASSVSSPLLPHLSSEPPLLAVSSSPPVETHVQEHQDAPVWPGLEGVDQHAHYLMLIQGPTLPHQRQLTCSAFCAALSAILSDVLRGISASILRRNCFSLTCRARVHEVTGVSQHETIKLSSIFCARS